MLKMKLIPFILAIVILFTSCSVYDKAKEKLSEAESAIDSKSEEYLEKYDPKRLAKDEAEEIFEYLRANGIIVRRFDKPSRISEYLRISIGTDEEMDRLIEVLKEYLGK